eukprot:TRINITY_DN14124_c0_g1_i4.p1 TRINITY_DN14124_c0_g1~~TRINITY_DN14124_c0_g1_i4.p1  ORF type:complete len:172 (+),score=19.72 TRINITY_DN14124_c0_g1_i4:211-726(+)
MCLFPPVLHWKTNFGSDLLRPLQLCHPGQRNAGHCYVVLSQTGTCTGGVASCWSSAKTDWELTAPDMQLCVDRCDAWCCCAVLCCTETGWELAAADTRLYMDWCAARCYCEIRCCAETGLELLAANPLLRVDWCAAWYCCAMFCCAGTKGPQLPTLRHCFASCCDCLAWHR